MLLLMRFPLGIAGIATNRLLIAAVHIVAIAVVVVVIVVVCMLLLLLLLLCGRGGRFA